MRVKKRIGGHVYDTRRATLVGHLCEEAVSTAVFRTKSGEFFLLKYADGTPREPGLGAIGAATQEEAELVAARPGFSWETPDAFDRRETVRTSLELTARDREQLRLLCTHGLDGQRRKKRVGMGEAVSDLLAHARATTALGELAGLDALAGARDPEVQG